MWLGIGSGLLACALWGVTYMLPVLLPGYSPAQAGLARCVILGGAAALMLAVFYRRRLRGLTPSDWLCAGKLAVIGMLINFIAMLYCSAWAGVSISGLTTGAIPVCVAIIANERDRKRGKPFLRLRRLVLPLLLISAGFILCNFSEFGNIDASETFKFFCGVALGLSHTALWTWYPIVNAEWLQDHPATDASTWATMQCALLLPAGIVTYLAYWHFLLPGVPILGDEPRYFVLVLLANGLACGWGATALWNFMSQRVPTSLSGQLMVFETVFAVLFIHVFEQRWPSPDLLAGVAVLIFGVSYSLRLFNGVMKEA